MSKEKCTACNGDGWYPDHASIPHADGECDEACPIQVQCERCMGTGSVRVEEDEMVDTDNVGGLS